MRADRLISLLMLLQARGRMTARELAAELECSERTVYRDVDALSAAGVPVYGDAGPAGGYALLDNYRTELTGLTEPELQALFMLAVPASLAELGVADDLRAALLKLAGAAPARARLEEERTRQRFYLDSRPWAGVVQSVPHLHVIQQAAWEDRRARFAYRLSAGVRVEYTVDVLGLAARDGGWYVIYRRSGCSYVLPVRDLLDVELLDERFLRPPDFDLEGTWKQWCAGRESGRLRYAVTARVDPRLAARLPRVLGPAIVGPWGDEDRGWRTVKLYFDTLEMARERLLIYGGAVEVLQPEPLRRSIADYAAQIAALYA